MVTDYLESSEVVVGIYYGQIRYYIHSFRNSILSYRQVRIVYYSVDSLIVRCIVCAGMIPYPR